MAKNPTISRLDPAQAFIRCYDEPNDALRIDISESSVALTIDADAGDNIAVVQSSVSQVVNLTVDNTGEATVILGPVAIAKYSKAAIFLSSTSDISAADLTVQLQVSPDDTADVWVNLASPVTAGQNAGDVVTENPALDIVARRAQLVISAALDTEETLDVYLVLST